jgi:hypothetical protein
MNVQETSEIRELSANELDLISGAEVRLYDIKIGGVRMLGGISDNGYVYYCVFTPNGQGGCH